MSIRVALHHQTTYHYDRLVSIFRKSCVCVRRPTAARRSTAIRCGAAGAALSQLAAGPARQLPRRGWCFPKRHGLLSVEVDLGGRDDGHQSVRFLPRRSHAEQSPSPTNRALIEELRPYLGKPKPPGPRLAEFIAASRATSNVTVDFLIDVNQRVQHAIGYVIRLDPGVQSCEETLTGSQRILPRSAWLLVQVLRHLGLAARFVSGYLIQLAPDVTPLDGPAGSDHAIFPTCTPGPKSICPAPAGSDSTRRRACLPAKDTFRWPARPISRRPRRLPARSSPARRRSASR